MYSTYHNINNALILWLDVLNLSQHKQCINLVELHRFIIIYLLQETTLSGTTSSKVKNDCYVRVAPTHNRKRKIEHAIPNEKNHYILQ